MIFNKNKVDIKYFTRYYIISNRNKVLLGKVLRNIKYMKLKSKIIKNLILIILSLEYLIR